MAETSDIDESTKVLNEYLELFHCIGYRFKYYLAPNAVLDFCGTGQVRGALAIHDFLLRKFRTQQHIDFDKATFCSPIEQTESHFATKQLPKHSAELTHPTNKVTGVTSLKLRADSDIEDADISMETDAKPNEKEHTPPTSSKSEQQTESCYESTDESIDSIAPQCKRAKYSTPPPTPFKYLRRLPTKRAQYSRRNDSSSEYDSSDDDDNDDEVDLKKEKNLQSDYTQLRYIEAIGKIRETEPKYAGAACKTQEIRLRLSYRKNLKNQTIQFALIIYERQDQKSSSKRKIRMPDFSKCTAEDDLSSTEDSLECLDLQPAVILSTLDGEERETIATVATPSSADIATALEDAAFSVQPPIQRTPTKATPIPPGTPKRRPRSAIVGISGVAPLSSLATAKKSQRTSSGRVPKLNAARSLRL